MWTQVTGQTSDTVPLDVRIAGRAAEILSFLGIPITTHVGLDDGPPPDIVIACDINLPPDADPRGRWEAEAGWLTRCHAGQAVVCSVCTGSVLLADAGLLQNVDATTHWVARDLFARYYPSVRLNAARVLLPAGPDQRIVTSGGTTTV